MSKMIDLLHAIVSTYFITNVSLCNKKEVNISQHYNVSTSADRIIIFNKAFKRCNFYITLVKKEKRRLLGLL